ncbi:TadE family type IV pilus minor pilin [Mycolicibacter kumamotonensis]|uniref:Pilus assembly protein TadE n=1 Tax=Mycolicibacter kumamotonensis TaxID=354243 RepID=A0A1B8SAU3_9MYCO|nr:TadE family type IV pilus minor pilin [Mycolicibacter kumamotonensis]NDJ89952.1 pilus assembly protein TadE [Mycolicibacter kumamotonensis]OBY29837.1 pilus assembly protein TadE [Mycolicibacter kumamotonensis]ORA81528.1 pilus assembly protein TadE [Mycolicibacter kumamotonensis]
MTGNGRLGDDTGASTVEAAFALAALVSVLVLCLAGFSAVSAQLRCLDAAREAARLAARGDTPAATAVAQRIAPAGAAIRLRSDGEFVVATVTVRPALLPGLAIAAEAVSAAEPSR